MRVVLNQKLAERSRKFTTYLFLITLASLIGGFVLVNLSIFTDTAPNIGIVFLQVLILPVAFILTLLSVRMTNAWARRPYPEDAIADGLKGMSKKSVLYHYYHQPARHVLVAPQGVFAIETRWHNGRFTVDGDRWTVHKGALSRFFSLMRMDGIGNPTDDARRAAAHVEKLLAPFAPDVEVQPVILFTDSRAELEVKDPQVPVLYADDKLSPNLTEYMREQGRQTKATSSKKVTLPLSDEQIQDFERRTVKK